LRALYLGNWLTDVSQAIDPVAYWSASKKGKGSTDTAVESVKKAIEKFVAQLVGSIFERSSSRALGRRMLKALKQELDRYARDAKDQIQSLIDFFLAVQTDERDARLAQFFRDCFLVKGYFKFVHPAAPKEPQRMNFESFMRVFGRPGDTRGAGVGAADDRPGAYTQYYPHEHLDRPEILPPQDPSVFHPGKQLPFKPFRISAGKQDGTRSPRNSKRINPDLYSFLRDNIEMTAGLLTEVDLSFKEVFARGFHDDDANWYITLAKLGHALHQVEDFFAHSNWAELAAKRLGPDVFKKIIPPQTKVEMIDRAYTMYQKRLKRHLTLPNPDWRKQEDEEWVVTGFFDFTDTLISLAHLAEEIFGMHVPDPYVEGYHLVQEAQEAITNPKAVEDEITKVIRQTSDFLTDPKRALEDPENKIAQSLKDRFGDDINKIRRPGVPQSVAQQVAQESRFLNAAPKDIQNAFFSIIIEGNRIYTVGKSVFTLYEAIHDISKFIASPLDWLVEWLPGELKKRFLDALKFYGRERFYDWLGAGRIGCHSLMAKDHGLEVLYDQQKDCAIGVHWYIVHTLLRWKDKPDSGYFDWLELLEFFLRNPLPPAGYGETDITASAIIVHITRQDDQLKAKDPMHSLEDLYRPTSVEPDRFTWRTIADINYNTTNLPMEDAFDAINQVLRESGTGYPVTTPNYAYKKDVRVLIPHQKIKVKVCMPPEGETLWYKDVFDKGWKVFSGYDDDAAGISQPPLEYHQPKVISLTEAQRIIIRGKKLRREAREAYRPQN
jgi:hypothetical protein